MRIVAVIIVCVVGLSLKAQPYVLKDLRPDTPDQIFFDSLPLLCDSFFNQLKYEDLATIKKFVPTVKYLKYTFDTLAVDYNLQMVVSRQQLLQRSLQKDYFKLLKRSRKKYRLKLKHLVQLRTDYQYGKNEDNHEFCYVTIHCYRRKKEFAVKFLAIKLVDNWFMADDLMLIVE